MEMVKKFLIILLMILFLGSCEFFLNSPFPGGLSFYDQYIDIGNILGGSHDVRLNIAGQYLVVITWDGPPRAIIVNSAGSVVTTAALGSFDRLCMEDVSGNLLVGDKWIDTSLVLKDLSSYVSTYGAPINPSDSGFIANYGGNNYYLIASHVNDYTWEVKGYATTDWASNFTASLNFNVISSKIEMDSVSYDPDPDGNPATPDDGIVVFIFHPEGTEYYMAIQILYSVLQGGGSFYGTGLTDIILDAVIFSHDSINFDSYARGGVVIYYSDKNTIFLYRWDETVIQSNIFYNSMSNHEMKFVFDPSGSYWYSYNGKNNDLFRGKTWW